MTSPHAPETTDAPSTVDLAAPGSDRPEREPGAVPISARDAVWDGYHFVVLNGPLEGLDVDRWRAALAASVATAPFLAWRRVDARRWLPVPPDARAAHLERLLVADPGLDGSSASIEAMLAQPLLGLPLRIVVGPEHVAVHFDHVFGDASVIKVWEWLLSLVADPDVEPGAASGGAPGQTSGRAPRRAVAVPEVIGSHAPFRTALAHTFGRVPPPSALVATADLVRRERAGQRAGAPPERWDPAPSVEVAAGGAQGTAALREHRRAHPGVTAPVLLLAAVWAVLREHGVVPDGVQPSVGTNLRRYLPRRAVVSGNFTTAVRLPPGSVPDPAAMQSALAAAGDSGVPLLAASGQAALGGVRRSVRAAASRGAGASGALGAAVGRVLGRGRDEPGADEDLHHVPALTLNHMGRLAEWERQPWAPGRERTIVMAPSVDSSRAVTVNIAEALDGFHLLVSFHDSVIPRADVRAALDDLVERLPEVLSSLPARP